MLKATEVQVATLTCCWHLSVCARACSCRTEPLTCGVWRSLWLGSVRTELHLYNPRYVVPLGGMGNTLTLHTGLGTIADSATLWVWTCGFESTYRWIFFFFFSKYTSLESTKHKSSFYLRLVESVDVKLVNTKGFTDSTWAHWSILTSLKIGQFLYFLLQSNRIVHSITCKISL